MNNSFMNFIITQRLLVLVIVFVIAGIGWYSLSNIPIDSFPDVTNNQVQVLTTAGNLSPLEVEKLVTFPIETAINGIPKVEEIRSISKYGLSVVTVIFNDDVDLYFARQLLLERLQYAANQLPPEADDPVMGPMTSALGEIYQYEVRGNSYNATELRTIQDWIIKPVLKTIPGVTEINSFGGFVLQYQVLVDQNKLYALGIPLADVFQSVADGNQLSGGNYLEKNREQYIIRGIGTFQSVEDIGNSVVTVKENVPVKVRDIATVEIGGEIRQGSVTRDGRGEVVTGIVMMLKGENSREVIQRIHEAVTRINSDLESRGIRIESFYDQSALVDRTIHTVTVNLIEGGFLVIAILLVFLGNIRAALIVALVIPFSMLFAFIGMNWLGLSANLMSLGAIDFGMIVDGSVVMMENIMRKAHREPDKNRLKLIIEAGSEMLKPVIYGVLIIIMVLIPILTFEGMERKMFTPMALTIGLALLGSLLLALTLIPVAASFFLKGTVAEKEPKFISKLRDHHNNHLTWAFNHRKTAVVISVFILLASSVLFLITPAEFVPKLDEGSILVEVKRLPGITLDESTELGNSIAGTLKNQFPDEIISVVAKTGRPDIANDFMGVHETDIFITLFPSENWKKAESSQELEEAIRTTISPWTTGAFVNFTQPIAMRVDELVAGVKSDIAVRIFGEDLNTLKDLAGRVNDIVRELPATENSLVEQVSGQPYLNIRYKRDEMARFGVTAANISQTISIAIGGRNATEMIEGQKRFGVLVRLNENQRKTIRDIHSVMINTPDGKTLPLGQFAEIAPEEGPAQISHDKSLRRILVEANVKSGDLAKYISELDQRIHNSIQLPIGYFIEYGGEFENQERAMGRLALVIPLVLALIFFLLFSAFQTVRYSLLILLNIPFAMVGGIWLLFLRGIPVSVSSSIGFIILFGVAVLNGIVMVSAFNSLREQGLTVREAVRQGVSNRLRPVLMTALVATFGFIPMALSTGPGAEVQRPLATVVIGGLISSTLLTLILLPLIYDWVEERANRLKSLTA